MNTTPCVPCCSEPVVTNVPGAPGLQGEQGPQGEQGEQGEPGDTPELLDYEAYAAGTAYTVTATPALAAFGTTNPSVTLGAAGRYMIMSRATFNANAATFAASRTITSYLYNATSSATIANSTKATLTPVTTTDTLTLPPYGATVIYTSTVANEVIQLWTSVSVVPSAGTLTVAAAEIVAIKLD